MTDSKMFATAENVHYIAAPSPPLNNGEGSTSFCQGNISDPQFKWHVRNHGASIILEVR